MHLYYVVQYGNMWRVINACDYEAVFGEYESKEKALDLAKLLNSH